jgi:hypothetical protein
MQGMKPEANQRHTSSILLNRGAPVNHLACDLHCAVVVVSLQPSYQELRAKPKS